MFDIKNIYEPNNLDEALEYLNNDENSEIISGGTDVLIWIRDGRYAGRSLVSIHNMNELKGVEILDNGNIEIKSATSFYDIINNNIINKYLFTLREAVEKIGGPQTRQIGTIGGNICNGATSADSASTLVAYDCDIELKTKEGNKIIPISEWYIGPGKTVKKRNEIVTKFIIKKNNYENYFGSFYKYGKRNAMEISTLNCCTLVKLDNNKINDVRLAFGVANPIPKRIKIAEDFLKNKNIDEDFYDEFGEIALKNCSPRDSWRASKEFREHIIKQLSIITLKQAIENAKGNINNE